MHSYYRMFAGAALVALTLATPFVGQASAVTPPAHTCQAGDIVHDIAPGVVSVEPRRGFNPLTASDAQLDCYGVPTRPTDAAGLSQWTARMNKFHYVVPVIDTALSIQPSGAVVGIWDTYLWTGYENLYGDNGSDYYNDVSGAYTVPTVASGVGYTQDVGNWVGLGGDEVHYPQSSRLWQAGTVGITGASAQYVFFYENFGCAAPAPCPNNGNAVGLTSPAVTAGQKVYVRVNNQTGLAYLQNTTTGATSTLYVSIDNANTGLSAEWINEENLCPSACTVTRFTDPAWNSAYAYGSTLSTYFDLMNSRRIDLRDAQDGNKIVAVPTIPQGFHGYDETCCSF